MTTRVYIGLGANLNDPLQTVKSAIDAIGRITDSNLAAVSKIYRSEPMGPVDQPDYINCVVAIDTALTPAELFDQTCTIEQHYGRTRNGEHWGPRTLDLDILLFGNEIIATEQLTIPHYGLKEREFVIYPLLDINPELILPCGTFVKGLTQHIPLNGMESIN